MPGDAVHLAAQVGGAGETETGCLGVDALQILVRNISNEYVAHRLDLHVWRYLEDSAAFVGGGADRQYQPLDWLCPQAPHGEP